MKQEYYNENATKKCKLDYDYFLNEASGRRQPSPLRLLAREVARLPTNAVNLGGGYPNICTFPITDFRVTLQNGSYITIAGELANEALQYQPSSGFPKLLTILKQIQDKVHGPQPWNEKRLITCCGSQEALFLIFEIIQNIGDPVIVQHTVYSGMLHTLKPYNSEFIIAEEDQDGPIPHLLANKLKERSRSGKPMPKILYVNPTGCNPTGITIANTRKKQLYQLACEYNFLILEDDPYYYLSFNEEAVSSFLSMDIEGRVIRIDSFSKIVSAGLRLGFITGPAALIDKIEYYIQASTIHPSSLSQVVVFKLLEEWKLDGFVRHTKTVTHFYKKKRDFILSVAEKYLKEVAEWNAPKSGFFLWLRLKHLSDTRHLIRRCIQNLIVIAPGDAFCIVEKDSCPYFRLCFSTASEEEVIRAISKLAVLIQDEMQQNSETEIIKKY